MMLFEWRKWINGLLFDTHASSSDRRALIREATLRNSSERQLKLEGYSGGDIRY